MYILVLMQPSYVLLPSTNYPKPVGGMCYTIIGLTPIGLEQPLVTSQWQAREANHAIPAYKCRQAIPVCSCPITVQASQTCYPACIVQTSYPSMQTSYPSMYLPNQRPGKPDKISQHAWCRQAIPACSHPITGQGSQKSYPSLQSYNQITNHRPGKPESYPSMHSADKISQHALQNIHCIKEAAEAQNSGQAETAK